MNFKSCFNFRLSILFNPSIFWRFTKNLVVLGSFKNGARREYEKGTRFERKHLPTISLGGKIFKNLMAQAESVIDPEDVNILLKETYLVLDVDCDPSESSDNVNQIHCHGVESKTDLVLDVYSPLFSVKQGDKIRVEIVNDVQDNSTNFENLSKPKFSKEFEKYDYIVNGKIFKIEDKMIGDLPAIAVYASFGGLQMRLQSDPMTLTHLRVDQEIFLCIRATKKSKSLRKSTVNN